MSRTRTLVFASCVGWCALASLPAAQPDRAARGRSRSEPLDATQVRGGLYQVAGGGGNAFFYVGPEEVLIVDAKSSPAAAGQVLAAARKVSDKPVRRILLTHSDGDHVNGLAGYASAQTIISHAGTRRDIVQANESAATKLPLPDVTFARQLNLYLDDVEVQLHYFGPAHTSGDAVVFIPSQKAAIVGDLVFVGRDPLIHAHKKGTSFGLVSVLKSILQLDADVFLSGHSDAVDRKTVESLAAAIEQKQAKVKALIAEGKTLDEIKTALGVAGGGRWPSLVEIVYRELTAKK